MKLAISIAGAAVFYCTNAFAQALTSAYTKTDDTSCNTVAEDEETGDRTRQCPGLLRYRILVVESDDRTSITLVTPDGRNLPLNFWDIVTPTFSTLENEVEWRVSRTNNRETPKALIVQVRTFDQTDVTHPKPFTILAVVRIGLDDACVTAKIPAAKPNANVEARQAADNPHRA